MKEIKKDDIITTKFGRGKIVELDCEAVDGRTILIELENNPFTAKQVWIYDKDVIDDNVVDIG